MATNSYKVSEGTTKRRSVFGRMDTVLRLPHIFEHGLPIKYVPYVLFVTAITIFYIGNNHFADKTTRKIDRLKVEVEDLRADYTTLKSDYMFSSKQSEVARNVARLGIQESVRPPEKIVIEEGEY